MTRHVALRRIALRYGDGLVLHTASSGAVPVLDELRLIVTRDGAIEALGATRLNIAYLTGLSENTLIAACLDAAAAIDWRCDWASLPARLDAARPALPAAARMLFETAAMEGAARAGGRPLSAHLGGGVAASTRTNQTLFHADDDATLARAAAYVARGFRDLKLRVGFGDLADDVRRLRLLRSHFGAGITLSADVNGAWGDAAAAQIAELADLRLAYVEQPVAAADWTGIAALRGTLPVMLDESLADLAAVGRLAESRAAPLAHLKLAKLGGLDRLGAAAATLRDAGIAVMVGQMNEGVVSTLAAAHLAVALDAPWRELYGADGLVDDPAGALRYADGALHLPPGPGIGLTRHDHTGTLLWDDSL